MDQDGEKQFSVCKNSKNIHYSSERDLLEGEHYSTKIGPGLQTVANGLLNIFQCKPIPKTRMGTRVEGQYNCGMS